MADIYELLEQINSAIYGEDVRSSIHDSIEQCYYDATGHPYSVSSLIRTMGALGDIVQSDHAESGTTDTLEDDSWAIIDSIDLAPGTWILFGGCLFDSASSGIGEVTVDTRTTVSARTRLDETKPFDQGVSVSVFTHRLLVNSETTDVTYYLHGHQTSGDSITVSPYLWAIQVKGVDDGEVIEPPGLILDGSDYLCIT